MKRLIVALCFFHIVYCNEVLLVNEQTFQANIQSGIVVADFYAAWCGPCKAMAPILQQVSNESEDCKVIKIDITRSRELAMKYNIESIPTLIFFQNGKEKKRTIGLLEKQAIYQEIEKLRGSDVEND